MRSAIRPAARRDVQIWNRRNYIRLLAVLSLIAAVALPFIPQGKTVSAHHIDVITPCCPVATEALYIRMHFVNGVWQAPALSNFYQAGRDQGARSSNSAYPWTNYNPSNARPYNGAVILDFGAPALDAYGNYGTWLVRAPGEGIVFMSANAIVNDVEQYAIGFWDNTPGTSQNPPILRILVGTSNSNTGTGVDPAQAGKAWGNIVNQVANRIQADGYSSQITVAGAIDIEPSWSSSTWAHNWIVGAAPQNTGGYYSTAQHVFYNYGSADGCYPDPTSAGNTCNNGWYQDDVWYVSRGAPNARAMPQIYKQFCSNNPVMNCQAKQWQKISLQGYVYHGGDVGKIQFSAALTEFNDCHNCDNDPQEGWTQLMDMLNNNDPGSHGSDPNQNWCTSPSVGTCHRTDHSNIGWSVDIGDLY